VVLNVLIQRRGLGTKSSYCLGEGLYVAACCVVRDWFLNVPQSIINWRIISGIILGVHP
jgi:hypothetical protein